MRLSSRGKTCFHTCSPTLRVANTFAWNALWHRMLATSLHQTQLMRAAPPFLRVRASLAGIKTHGTHRYVYFSAAVRSVSETKTQLICSADDLFVDQNLEFQVSQKRDG